MTKQSLHDVNRNASFPEMVGVGVTKAVQRIMIRKVCLDPVFPEPMSDGSAVRGLACVLAVA